MAQVKSRVRCELRLQRLDRREDRARIVGAAQAGLPRPGYAMEHGGDAVGDCLPVAVDKRDVERDVDARARHDLPLKGVAVNIDNARKQQETSAVECPGAGLIRTDGGNEPVARADVNGRILEAIFDQDLCAGDAKIHAPTHATAVDCAEPNSNEDSWRSRKASTDSARKSASAARNRSCGQSHHANDCRRAAMSSENRGRITRAGLPA